jgi:dUTP pyrophosphatase
MKIKYFKNCDYEPLRFTPGSAGFDVFACIKHSYVLKPGEIFLVPTGFGLDMELDEIVGMLLPRSSLSIRRIVLSNSVGVIDSDYHDEIRVPLINNGSKEFSIMKGMRVAQLLFVPIWLPKFEVVEHFNNFQRGGFGSTGL